MSPPPIPHAPTSSDSHFTPRREFLREDRVQSSFSILTLSGSSLIRAYSIAPGAVAALRRYLERSHLIIGKVEDAARDFYEFMVEGKPWSNPKSVHAEKLLVDLLTVLYKNNYVLLSTIDYGREQDDRVIMAFSRPVASAIPQTSSMSSSAFPGASNASLPHVTKVPFAISFPNTTTLRVISPPLHSTPAILKTVRDSWPRGVVSEKKAGDGVYEFKLKGYKWFQEDTFATDSLRHILTLLGTLDSYGFTLLTSLSLKNRSRDKDLWIFTGASYDSPEESPVASPTAPKSELKRSRTFEGVPHHPGAHPTATDVFARSQGHVRTASDTATSHRGRPPPLLAHHPAVLRKPAPRAQLPVSVAISNMSHDGLQQIDASSSQRRPSEEVVRATLASTVGSAFDMTGVGTRKYHNPHPPAEGYPGYPAPPVHTSPALFYAAAPDTNNPYFPSIPGHDHVPADSTAAPGALAGSTSSSRSPPHQARIAQDAARPPAPRTHDHPHPLPSRSDPSSSSDEPEPSVSGNSSASHSSKPSPTHSHALGTPTPPLLSPTAFRDSAFSSGTEQTCEIPITWTGTEQERIEPRIVTTADEMDTRAHNIPGGWISPVEEKVREEAELDPRTAPGQTAISNRDYAEFRPRPHDLTPERQHVKVGAPEIVQPHAERTSEAAVLNEGPHKERRRSMPHRMSHEKEKAPAVGPDAQGWVMVNVGGTGTPSSQVPPPTPSTYARGSPHSKEGPAPAPAEQRRQAASPGAASGTRSPPKSQTPPHQSSMSPAAKAIVLIDAVDAQKNAKKKDGAQPSSGLRRIFSLSRSGSPSPSGGGKVRKPPPAANGGSAGINKPRSFEQEEKKGIGLRERWRRRATPEASKSSKRMSVD